MADCRDWSGHVIVCGLHSVGLRTVEQLHAAGVQVVVIDPVPDQALVAWVRAWDVPVMTASPHSVEGLTAAGLQGASAVVCVERSDLQSLETALLVGELRPELRLVVQLANAAVGRAVQGAVASARVLDVAALAAPAMVEACLGDTKVDLELGGEKFVVADLPVAVHPDIVKFGSKAVRTLRALYGSLVPIAVMAADGVTIEICPGRDREVEPTDHVWLLGTPAELEDANLSWKPEAPKRVPIGARYAVPEPDEGPLAPVATSREAEDAARRHPVRVLRYAIGSAINEIDRRLRIVIGALIVIAIIAMIVLHAGYRFADGRHMSWLDSMYFTVETLGTVGYGDFNFSEQSATLRGFAIGLMIAGALTLASFFALLTNLLVSRRLEDSLGKRRITGMHGHVVVIGLGAIGVRVVETLRARKRDVVVIESDENNRNMAHVRDLGARVYIGDATTRRTLDAVNLRSASAVAVLTSDDLTNIESALAIQDQLGDRWVDVPVPVRIFDRQLARRIERDFGFRHVRSTAALAAPWFVGAALGLQVSGTFYVGPQPFLVASMDIVPGSGLDGLAMQELSGKTRVVALARAATDGALEHPPRRDTRFAAGDRAYLIGPYEELLQVLRRDAASVSAVAGQSSESPQDDLTAVTEQH